MHKLSKIYVAGHNGMVGSAILQTLKNQGFENIIVASSKSLDLTNQSLVNQFFSTHKPEYIFLAAAKVGGILANNSYQADFIYQNLLIGANVIHASYLNKVKGLINIGSSCIYPKLAPQPLTEDSLMSGKLELTNEGYAIAKIAAIKLCKYYNQQYGTNFISLMPCNQYGINDNFNMETAHVIPMLLRRFHLAKLLQKGDFNSIKQDLKQRPLGFSLDQKINFSEDSSLELALNQIGAYKNKVTVWGDGSVYREFMNAQDLANACIYFIQAEHSHQVKEFINIGAGKDILLKDLFTIIQHTTDFKGAIEFDTTKPNGTPRKLLDISKATHLGWHAQVKLKEGIHDLYKWYTNTRYN